jgi:hypothetical protein
LWFVLGLLADIASQAVENTQRRKGSPALNAYGLHDGRVCIVPGAAFLNGGQLRCVADALAMRRQRVGLKLA